MSRQAKTLRELGQIRAEHHAFLGSLPYRTALGRKNFTADRAPDGRSCIIVYVPRRLPMPEVPPDLRVPPRLTARGGGMYALTDVVEIEVEPPDKLLPPLRPDNQLLRSILSWRRGPPWAPLRPGCRLGYGRAIGDRFVPHSGSLGCLVRDVYRPRLVGLLTNHHVGREPGQSFYRPAYKAGAQRVAMVRRSLHHISDEEWIPGVNEPNAYIIIDASFAQLTADVPAANEIFSVIRRRPTPEPLGRVYPINYDSIEIIGKPVRKIGQRSGVQEGIVVAVGISQPHPSQDVDAHVGQTPAAYYADLAIAPRSRDRYVSLPGDSGSLVVIDTQDANRNRPVALLWGGATRDVGRDSGPERLSYATNLQRILKLMNLEMLPT